MTEISQIYTVLAVACFIGLLFMLVMIAAAAWSVNRVTVSTDNRINELSGKFSLLIDVLLKQAEREVAHARAVETIVEEHIEQH